MFSSLFSSFGGCALLFSDAQNLWDPLLFLESYLRSLPNCGNKESPIPKGVYLENEELITIGKNVVIDPGVFIEGPCMIADGAHIRFGAYLRKNTYLGEGAVLGHSSEVKGSIFLPHAKAPHFNYVGDSIVGFSVNLGAGAILSNVRLDSECVSVFWDGEKVRSPLRKLGAFVGDFAQIGCHVVLNPGSVIFPRERVLPASCRVQKEKASELIWGEINV